MTYQSPQNDQDDNDEVIFFAESEFSVYTQYREESNLDKPITSREYSLEGENLNLK